MYKVSVSDQYCRYHPEFYLVLDQKGNQWYRTSLVNRQHAVKAAVHVGRTSHTQAAEMGKKPIREIATMLGVAKLVWYILRKKQSTGELSNAKKTWMSKKATVVDDRRIISMVVRKPLYNNQMASFFSETMIPNTLPERCLNTAGLQQRL